MFICVSDVSYLVILNEKVNFRRILDYSNKNPWLYAVYVVLIGLPLVLIITFCCASSSTDKQGESKLKKQAKNG